MKYCTKCCKNKLITEFNKCKSRKDGLQGYCKDCEKIYKKNYKEEYPWRVIFNDINQRCNNLNDTGYKNYGKKGIKNFLTEKEIEFLWFRDKAYNMKKPSIDREDNDGNYELSNCRFIEFVENAGKDKRKIILQFDIEDTFIREWKEMIEIEKILNIDHSYISKCCSGKQKTASGYKWRYKNV